MGLSKIPALDLVYSTLGHFRGKEVYGKTSIIVQYTVSRIQKRCQKKNVCIQIVLC